MSETPTFVVIDLVPLGTALAAGSLCALLGNLLVLRRTTLMADALSHAVLPGIVVGFLVAGGLEPLGLLAGGVAAGLVMALLVVWLRTFSRVEGGAALGAVFSTLFALGVVLLAATSLDDARLSVEEVLAGHLSTLIWFPPQEAGPLALWASLPSATRTVAIVLAVVLPFVWFLRKELIVCAFDAPFARTIGLRPGLLEFALYAAVSAAAVAAFEAIGSILVVALFACPAAAARRLTDSVRSQVAWSLLFAIVVIVAGYFLAGFGPALMGSVESLSPSGTIAAMAAIGLWAAARLGAVRDARSGRASC